MSLIHPEMRELPVNGSSVVSTERDEQQNGCQEAYLLVNHCKTETESDLATLSPTSIATRQHTFRVYTCHHWSKYSSGSV